MLAVLVSPRSGRDEIAGWKGSELVVRVTSAPEGGKANAATCQLIAAALGVSKGSVRVKRGQTSRHKVLEIAGVGDEDVRAALGQPDDSLF
jgi:uncharacterized protein